jgi:RHS repeat-associated protein
MVKKNLNRISSAWVRRIAICLLALLVTSAATGSEQLYFYHLDHLGTPQVVTDVQGQVVWQGEYQPFGQVEIVTGAVVNNERFAGQYFDEESNNYYNYFRDYDPTTGRYLQSDPIGLDGGINTYLYAMANPMRFSDLLGLKPKPCPPGMVAPGVPCTVDDGKGNQGAPPECATPECAAGIPPIDPWPGDLDYKCWAECRLKKMAICQAASAGGAGVGATVGGIVSIPSGGTVAPATVPVGAVIGEAGTYLMCTLTVDLECEEKCKNCDK